MGCNVIWSLETSTVCINERSLSPPAGFFFDVLFNPEDGDDIFVRNFSATTQKTIFFFAELVAKYITTLVFIFGYQTHLHQRPFASICRYRMHLYPRRICLSAVVLSSLFRSIISFSSAVSSWPSRYLHCVSLHLLLLGGSLLRDIMGQRITFPGAF